MRVAALQHDYFAMHHRHLYSVPIQARPSGVAWNRNKRNKNMLLSIINFFKSWKRYGVAVDELSHLSDRELADIGITRGDIPRIAWEQAKH
jgi:uncharacterized protein YjiS (DUF1127 family)